MSLAVAIWSSPTDYIVAADSLVTATHGEARGLYMSKVFRWGDYVGGWAGGVPAIRHLLAALRRQPLPMDREDVDAGLRAAWDAAVPLTGSTAAGDYPRTGAYLILAGPAGVVTMESYGEVIWTSTVDGVAYDAIGTSDYAVGWLDAHAPGVNTDLAARAVRSAIDRFPTVGGVVEALRREMA